MADTVKPTGPQKRPDSTPDDRFRLEALTLTYQASERADTPDRWPDALSPGSVLGPYRTVALLGQGGMGVVYEAEEIETGRRVALKVLSAERRRDVDRERFQREGRLAASLNHPHCVFVFGAWDIAGELVIAMELMRDTLAGWRKRQESLPSTAAVDAVLDVIAGLDAAAHAGILHRDVKPSNCFVDDDGRIKIGDLGISISAHVPDDSSQRASGMRVVGTPAYAAPEQLRGRALDARSDIYGVGATLYELVTGHVPFEREDLMALLMAVANDVPRAPHLVNPDHSARAECAHPPLSGQGTRAALRQLRRVGGGTRTLFLVGSHRCAAEPSRASRDSLMSRFWACPWSPTLSNRCLLVASTEAP